ncbi:hypothetical protein [Streptomyces noursei]|uniref:hypothetical protein n=1 Tax=Streptomyces noursei TaxID=1971 RepID=UPI0037F12813
MEPTGKPKSTPAGARPSRIVERLLAERHSLPLSIALHLAPGSLIVAVYLLIAEPLVKSIGHPPFLGWAVAMLLALVPFEQWTPPPAVAVQGGQRASAPVSTCVEGGGRVVGGLTSCGVEALHQSRSRRLARDVKLRRTGLGWAGHPISGANAAG